MAHLPSGVHSANVDLGDQRRLDPALAAAAPRNQRPGAATPAANGACRRSRAWRACCFSRRAASELPARADAADRQQHARRRRSTPSSRLPTAVASSLRSVKPPTTNSWRSWHFSLSQVRCGARRRARRRAWRSRLRGSCCSADSSTWAGVGREVGAEAHALAVALLVEQRLAAARAARAAAPGAGRGRRGTAASNRK